MRRGPSANFLCVLATLVAAVSLAGCGAKADQKSQTPAAGAALPSTVSSTPTAVTPPAGPSVRTVKWVELQVGECLADPPPTDPSVVNVNIVDCASPHAAEVYSRAPVGVDGALGDIASRACAAGFGKYTGRAMDGSAFSVTYLIDSDQDRTTDDPNASTVICLLQAADGRPLTQPARH